MTRNAAARRDPIALPQTASPFDVALVFEAAQQHGRDSLPEHEIGDLHQALSAAWALMTAAQRAAFRKDPIVNDILDWLAQIAQSPSTITAADQQQDQAQ